MADQKFSLLSLNVKGLRNVVKRTKIFYWLKERNYINGITYLQETHSDYKTSKSWSNQLKGHIFYSHGTTNSCVTLIIIGQNVEYKLKDKIIDDLGRYVILNCEIQGSNYLLINTYMPNIETSQVEFLREINDILSRYDLPESIIWGGDFNCPFDKIDTSGGNFKPKSKTITLLRGIIDSFDLCDIWRVRNEAKCQFTWRQKTPYIQRRLDYFLVSNNMQSIIKNVNITSAISTDHSAIVLQVFSPGQTTLGPSHWRLNVTLLKNEQYLNEMKANLPKWKLEASDQNNKILLWEFLKYKIREFSLKFSKHIAFEKRKHIPNLEKQVEALENNSDSNDKDKLNKLTSLRSELEEEYNRISNSIIFRSKTEYYEHGEKCTKYFLNLCKNNKMKSTVRTLRINNEEINNQDTIMNEIRTYFQSKYRKKGNITERSCKEFLGKIKLPSLSQEQVNLCDGPITLSEITKALKSMQNGKAPGNDGIPKEFYLCFIDILGQDLVNCLKMCWENECLSESQSHALITLIQKPGKDSRNLNSWRPISLINVDTKIISKVLASRLEKILPT